MNAVSLSSVCDVTMGQAPIGTSYNTDGIGVPLLAGAGDFGFDHPEPVKFTDAPTKLAQKGDLILCIRATIGDLNWADKEYCLGRGVAGLRPKNGRLDRNYLWHWLRGNRADLEKKARGSTFKQVSRRDIDELEIVLPNNLAEQRRLAAILDKADSVCRRRGNVAALANSLLCSGFVELFGEHGQYANALSIDPLGDHLAFVTSGSRGWAEHYSKDGARFIRSVDVRMNHISDKDAVFVRPPKSAEAERTRVRDGDILLTITGSLIGRVSAVRQLHRETFISQHVAILRPKSSLIPEFAAFFLSLPSGGQRQIQKAQYGQAKPGLNLTQIRGFQIPVPPICAQEKFLTVYQKLREAQACFDAQFDHAEILFSCLSQRAFRGEL